MSSGIRTAISALGRIAVTLDNEEGRAFLQERLSFFGKLAFLISLSFFVVGNLALLASVPELGLKALLSQPYNIWHALGLAVPFSMWQATRRGALSARVLTLIDALTLPVAVIAYGAMSHSIDAPPAVRPDLTLLSIVMTLLTARAILVPSRAGQTLVVSVLCSIPAVAVTVDTARKLNADIADAWLLAPLNTLLWCTSTVVIATVASRIIYGLRERAAQAQRLGQYELVEKIGEGGMGIVYRAHHAMLRRPTAVKLLPPEKTGGATISRFEREVRLTARLTHPNTVAVFDYGRTPDGVFYYAMELLDGIDLEHLVDRYGKLPACRVIRILEQVCGSLAEAHGIGLVHRDIKPANIILCERGRIADTAKVVDFGLVKQFDNFGPAGPDSATLSAINTIVGTPLYLAPEAITHPDAVDGRSDLYAVGAVGYFLLTGEPVFAKGSVMEVCASHLHETPVPPSTRRGSDLPAGLDAVILSCLAKLPEQRPESADALRAALSAIPGDPWTDDDAKRWWAEHHNDKTSPPQPRRDGSPTALTVDFEERFKATFPR